MFSTVILVTDTMLPYMYCNKHVLGSMTLGICTGMFGIGMEKWVSRLGVGG